MSDKPVYVYAAAYATLDEAKADYDALLDLHDADLVGSYDVAIISKDADGKVHVNKHEKPTQHGAWTGAAVGAVVGLLFPPALIGTAAVGAGAGALIGHFARGMSRDDMKELGDQLESGEAALVVVAESRVREQLDKDLTRAQRTVEKQVDADRAELERELKAAEKDTVVA
jgi:uncharacterized membrane protein